MSLTPSPQLGSMQKAYHELKEQALRMSAEQEMQKGQIEDEIKKLRMSNADLVRKTKVINNILSSIKS